MAEEIALDRDALYYPYIHIRDINWLKSTLLCFPSVKRIVPRDYTVLDSDEIQEFCEIIGPRGLPLLTSADLYSPRVDLAQLALLDKLELSADSLVRFYSRDCAVRDLPDPNIFEIHEAKIIYPIILFLKENGLAWRARRGRKHWLAMHPQLGAAIMTSLAIAIAEDSGLDIVTDSVPLHHSVVSSEDVFDALLKRDAVPLPRPSLKLVDQLAEIVITTSFDVRRLSARQIADLLNDGKDLRRFKNALLPVLQAIPPMTNIAERNRRLKDAAMHVLDEWAKYRKSLPKFALEALMDSTEIKFPELGTAMLGGATTYVQLGGAAALSITLLTYAGLKVFRKYREKSASPYQYLNRIKKSVSAMTLPPLLGKRESPVVDAKHSTKAKRASQ